LQTTTPLLQTHPTSLLSMASMHIPINHREFTDLLTRKPPPIDNIDITPVEMEQYLDLRPYYNNSALYASNSFSYDEAYKIVMVMGLRHLPILDHNHRVVGMLTREDLINKANKK